MRVLTSFTYIFLALAALSTPAIAQSTGGVFGPAVNANDRSAQLRLGFAPADDRRDDQWAARLHYQHALSDELRLRVVLQGNDFETGGFEPVFIQGEAQYELPRRGSYRHAVRMDGRIAEGDDGFDQIGLNYTASFPVFENTSLTVVGLTNLQLGTGSADDLGVETRVALAHRLDNGLTLSLDSFDAWGRSSKFQSFGRQRHQLGPRVSANITDDVSLLAGVLFGTSRAAPNTDFRLWLGKSFN